MDSNLRVFYGWTRINKVRKSEAISVIFENSKQNEDRTMRFINKMQDTVYIRKQTKAEAQDAVGINRMFTEYSIRLDDKRMGGELDKVLETNFEADKNHVSLKERTIIREELRKAYRPISITKNKI